MYLVRSEYAAVMLCVAVAFSVFVVPYFAASCGGR